MITVTCEVCSVQFEAERINTRFCRPCADKRKKQWHQANKEKVSANKREYYLQNKESILAKRREHWAKNKEKIVDAHREYKRQWVKSNRAKINAREKERRNTEPQFRIAFNLRRRFRHAINAMCVGKMVSSVKDLGCSIEELKVRFESLFLPGMTWSTYGAYDGGWTIDHIIPLSKFDLTKRSEQLKAVHFTNLQPMWWRDNISKGDKTDGLPQDFQPLPA